MKSNIRLLVLSLLVVHSSFAQNLDDALRYSRQGLNGTSRYVSMGGAFGALGGDLSAINNNPAAVGVFLYSELNITPDFNYTTSKASYLGSNASDLKFNFNLDNLGFVGSLKILEGPLKAINYGFTYKRTSNFHQNIYANGYNNSNTVTDYFAEQTNGTYISDLDEGNEYASDLSYDAYNAYLINPTNLSDTNTIYVSMYNQNGIEQSIYQQTTGYNSEYTFSVGFNYNDQLYGGLAIGFNSVRYVYRTTIEEIDSKNQIDNFKQMEYEDNFTTTANGYNFKLGLIYKITPWLRFGTSFQTPNVIKLSDSYYHVIKSSVSPDGLSYKNYNLRSGDGAYDYKIITPMRLMAGLGFTIDKKAVISMEYEYVEYRTASLRSYYSASEFSDANRDIKDFLAAGHNAKIGLEYRLGITSLRAGFNYLGSPYSNSQINKNAYTLYYTGGIGFNFNNIYIDMAYALGNSSYYQYPYLLKQADVQPYLVDKTTSQFLTTIGIRF
ncbi:MAG: hypothetical protein JXR60_08905 [Bacteroidales bacterium]|nr:hypothetical protein [Bacteroidales bacterium]